MHQPRRNRTAFLLNVPTGFGAWSNDCWFPCLAVGRTSRDPAWMNSSELLDAAGRRRSPATMPGFHCGRPPRNKGRSYPADPPTVEEIVAVMRRAGGRPWSATAARGTLRHLAQYTTARRRCYRRAPDSDDGPFDRVPTRVCVPTPTRVRERTRADVMPPAFPHRGAARRSARSASRPERQRGAVAVERHRPQCSQRSGPSRSYPHDAPQRSALRLSPGPRRNRQAAYRDLSRASGSSAVRK